MRLRVSRLLACCLAFCLLPGCASLEPGFKASPSLANALGFASIELNHLHRDYTNKDSDFLKVAGLDIHYRDVGEGETIVLLHGVSSSLHTWEAWVEQLRDEYRVISLDLPGFGLTGPLPKDRFDYQPDTFLHLFNEFVKRLDLDTFALAGNSFGGYIAARYAAEHPDKVTHLVLLNPAAYRQKPHKLAKFAATSRLGALGKFVVPPVAVTTALDETYGDPEKITQEQYTRYVHLSQRPGAKRAYHEVIKMVYRLTTEDQAFPFYKITAPTLLLWGEEDNWVPPELSQRWLDDIRGAQLVTYPGVGHFPMEESPAQSVGDARNFIAGIALENARTAYRVSEGGATNDAVEEVDATPLSPIDVSQ